MDWTRIVKSAASLYTQQTTAETTVIANRLKLGHLVLKLILDGNYGDNLVGTLAEDLSSKLGYKVYRQRLYEFAKVAKFFKTVEDIYNAADSRNVDWADVLQLCKLKRKPTIGIRITLDENDRDIAQYRLYRKPVRNDFLKEALRIGIKTLKHANKLPPLTTVSGVVTFAHKARLAS